MKIRCCASACLVLTLVGCTTGPDYQRPSVAAPLAWRVGSAESTPLSNIPWWEQFHDAALSGLVRDAIDGNLDLEAAAANVETARAQYGVSRSAMFPRVDAGASTARIRSSQNATTSGGQVSDSLGANLSASFEIDVWGRLRRATESARAGLLATEEGRNTVVLTLVASVANGYIQLRALDRQLEIARATSESLAKATWLQRRRFEEGAIPESDFRQAESQLRATEAQVPELERLIARQENFLAVLQGKNPGSIERGMPMDALQFPTVPQGLPAELLERRPDIRRAEQNLIATNANIGVARAAYFPRISLTALLGWASPDLSNLFTGPSRSWSYGLGATLPVFDAGRLQSQVAQAEAINQEALAAYRKSIIVAFQEVEDALIDRAKFTQALEVQSSNVAALRRFRDLAALRYQEGATIYLEVANAEQSLFNAQLMLVTTQTQLFQSYVNLYKAMGGAWAPEAEAG